MATKLERLGVKTHKYRANKLTYLEKDNQLVCPLCMQVKSNWHVNHFVMKMDGGTETKYNLTVLCGMCHRALHDGEDKERQLMWNRLDYFMLSRHGLIGRKQLLKRSLEKLNMKLSVVNVRFLHQLVKREFEFVYINSFAPVGER